MEKLKDIERHGKQAQGRKELVAHLEGERLTLRQMILAKCYDCMGYYADGRTDCNISGCALYPLMPYRKGEKYRTFTLSEDQIKARKERGRSIHRKTPYFALEHEAPLAGEKENPGGISYPAPDKTRVKQTSGKGVCDQ